jgi:hypothetical protein
MEEIVLADSNWPPMKSILTKPRTKKITSTEWHNLVVRNKAAEICEKTFIERG